MEEENAEERVVGKYHVQYILGDGYGVHHATGCYGGVNAQGDVIANFFSEQHAIPGETIIRVGEDGKTFDEGNEADKVGEAMRFVSCAVALRPSVARAVARWLNKSADMAEGNVAGNGEKEE